MKPYTYSLLAAAFACGMAQGAATAYTTPVGYVTTNCPADSDTVVSLPLRIASSAAGALSTAPVVSGSTADLTITGAAFTVNQFAGTHYAKFSSGTDAGKWFAITANTATTLTVNLNGATLTAIAADKVEILKFWTLAELFNPTTATTDPTTTPHAIVASTNTFASGRRTEVLIPDLASAGINLAPAANFYINGGVWKKQGQGNTSFDTYQLWPDSYFIIRNPVAVTSATNYTISGEVEPYKFNVPLVTQAAQSQDNFIGLPRPINVTLTDLGLANTAAFVASTNTFASGRRDELLVYDNVSIAHDKAPAANYYYHGGLWKKQGDGNVDHGLDVIPSGFGFVVRKYQTGSGATADWNNAPTY